VTPALLGFAVLLAAAGGVLAQASDSSPAAQDSALRVFFDCPPFVRGCDFDFLRTEITFVNHVRNREDAQVHILVTTQPTGGGGREYTLSLIGLKRFAGTADTLRYVSGATDTRDDDRQGLVRTIKLGLMRYVATTPLARDIAISYTAATPAAPAQVRDPWNSWVFRTRFNANVNGQASSRFAFLTGSFSANRTTDAWKLNLGLNYGYNESDFDVPVFDSTGVQVGTRTVTNIQRNYGLQGLLVRSTGPHWSAGGRASLSHSTFTNQKRALRLAPALEYDVFPYAVSTRKLLTLQYALGVSQFAYGDSTIFDQTEEVLFDQSLTISVNLAQPWGSISASIEAAHYLRDFHKNHVTLFSSVDIRLVRGLSLNLFGNVSLLRDQLYLSKRNLSAEDVLLQRRQLQTNYRYFAFVGLSYQFGSAINNIVNPRFGGSNGNFAFAF
jgi:hypothetical protein